jgi:potassium/hydrogen antiporter
MIGGAPLGPGLLLDAAVQLAVGGALGLGFGYGGRLLLKHVRLPAAGLYPVLTLALAFLAFGLPTLFHGSGLLAVYVAAVLLGSEAIRYRTGLLRVHDGLAWMAQVAMFLMLGLLSYPSKLLQVSGTGLGLGLVLAFVARPLVVVLCLLPFRYPMREALYVGWVGLRGAVPIILATFPVLANAPGALEIFHVVFFIVVVNAVIPGATVGWVTRKLGLVSAEPPPVPAMLEITSTQVLEGDLISFYVHPASAVAGATISELPFPPSAVITLIVRGNELVAPKGSTQIQVGDHAYVFCKPEDLSFVQLIFGVVEAS